MPDTPELNEFEQYKLLEKLGPGGQGQVWLAEHRMLGSREAVKILKEDQASDDSFVRRFKREAEQIIKLNHENIVKGYRYGDAQHRLFIAMELVEGTDLKLWLKQHHPIPLQIALLILLRVARALEYCHTRGVIHRDIKPANVMLRPDGVVKVIDFGLSKELLEIGSEMSPETKPGTVLGTLAYMAPEQLRGDAGEQPFPCDIYSLGAVAYELLSGVPPFSGTHAEVCAKVLTETPPPVSSPGVRLPAELVRLVQQMLEKRPAQRPGSMAEVFNRLESIARQMNLPVNSDLLRRYVRNPAEVARELGRPAPGAAPDSASVLRMIVGALTVTIALLLVVLFFVWRQSTPANPDTDGQAYPSTPAPGPAATTPAVPETAQAATPVPVPPAATPAAVAAPTPAAATPKTTPAPAKPEPAPAPPAAAIEKPAPEPVAAAAESQGPCSIEISVKPASNIEVDGVVRARNVTSYTHHCDCSHDYTVRISNDRYGDEEFHGRTGKKPGKVAQVSHNFLVSDGSVRVTGASGWVWIDGTSRGSVPLVVPGLKPGPVTLEIRDGSGKVLRTATALVKAGRTVELDLTKSR